MYAIVRALYPHGTRISKHTTFNCTCDSEDETFRAPENQYRHMYAIVECSKGAIQKTDASLDSLKFKHSFAKVKGVQKVYDHLRWRVVKLFTHSLTAKLHP